MGIKLKRVELSNIRTHKHIVFNPEQYGITAISGPNGSGKSTIVDSIVWALYGIKPEGVSKNAALIKSGVETNKETEKCFVSLNIVIDSTEYKIVREIINKGKSTECNVWELVEDENGEIVEQHKAGSAVSDAETHIRKILKMDKKGFLTAVLVQQKQVDNLISPTTKAKERAQVIEKLIGISSITKALESSRKSAAELKKELSYVNVSKKELENLEKEKEKEETTYEKNKKANDDLTAQLTEAKESNTALKEKLEEETKKSENLEHLKNKVSELKAQISVQEDNLKNIISEKDEKKNQLSTLESSASIEELEPKIKECREQLRRYENEKSILEKELKEAQDNLTNANELIEKSSIKTHEEAEKGLMKSQAQLDSFKEKISLSQAEIMSADSEIKKLYKAINVLSQGDGTCPTCLQHVKDVSVAVETLQKDVEKFAKTKEEEKSNIIDFEKAVKKVEVVIDKFNQLIDAIQLNELLSESIDEEKKEIERLGGLIKATEAEYTAFDKVYQAAKRKMDVKNDYNRLLERAKKISDEINAKNGELQIAEDEIKNSGVISSSALSKLRKDFDNSYGKYSKLYEKMSNVKSDMNVAFERSKNLTEKIDDYKQKLQQHDELMHNYEVANSTNNVIEKFREDRITHSIPVIEVYASDLMSRFTDGAFTRLKIDSKFNATVIRANGEEMAVGLLSGGELSAAAIALRLAISMLLNGGTSENLIILDEVLVSQDNTRASFILSTIKEVCKGQVIIVAHNAITDEISDKVIQLGLAA